MLTHAELAFLEQRRWRARYWNLVGGVLLAAVVGLAVWLLVRVPNLVNPFHVLRQIEAGTLPQSSLETMATLLPLAVMAVVGMLATVITFGFAVFANERRYLSIIDSLAGSTRD